MAPARLKRLRCAAGMSLLMLMRKLALERERAAAGELESAGALVPRASGEFETLNAALHLAGWLGQDLNPGIEHENTDC